MAVDERLLHEQAYEDYIIDADFHLHLPTEELYPYVDDPAIRDRLEERGPPPQSGKINTLRYGVAQDVRAGHDHKHGTAVTTEEIREACDELAIDVPVVQPGTNLEVVRSNYPTISNALVRAYNDYVVDQVIDTDRDVLATLLIPNWDVELALEELDRLGDNEGFVAVQNWLTTYQLWGDGEFDPIFERITELELGLILHIVAKDQLGISLATESVRTAAEYSLTKNGYSLIANVANMIMTGVFDAFPDLRVCVQEAGHLWIPYVAYRLDEIYQSFPNDVRHVERVKAMGNDYLDRLPSEYLFDNIYTATQPVAFSNIPNSSHVRGLLEASRAGDMFIYTSDWPHPTLDPAEWLYTTPGIDDELRARIAHENAEDLLRLPGG